MGKESLSKRFGFNSSDDKSEHVKQVSTAQIKSNPYQPRKYFDPLQLEELAKSIKEHGIIQPIIVRSTNNNYYELVAGERRLKAAMSIGLQQVPVIVRNLSDREIAEMAIIENLQRADLNFFEEAEGFRSLIEEFTLTQEDIAKRVGKSQSTIANKLRVLKLPEEVKRNISTDIITERHARALLKLPDAQTQLKILKEIYEMELNVRETDQLVEHCLQGVVPGNEPIVKKGSKIIRIFKDMRIYINTIRSAVTAIEETGQKVKMVEKNYDDFIEITIQLPKTKK